MADSRPWYRVMVQVPESAYDDVGERLFALGSTGIEAVDGPEPDCVLLNAYFGPETDPDALTVDVRAGLAGLLPSDGSATITLETVAATDWAAAWREYFKPVRASDRILVCPPWNRVPAPANGFTIVIEPKMAFGTGHHETTCLAIRGLQARVRAGQHVLDVGCGSGILSIAAVKLGATRVTAVDTDPQAIENTGENAALNGVEGSIRIVEGSAADAGGTYDVVAANILSGILVPLLPAIVSRLAPRGVALLGGVLERESDAFRESLDASGLRVQDTESAGEWVSFVATSER